MVISSVLIDELKQALLARTLNDVVQEYILDEMRIPVRKAWKKEPPLRMGTPNKGQQSFL